LEGGILAFHGAGQTRAAWEVRGNEKVINVFRRFWGADKVLTSMDGVLMWRSCAKTEKGWFHIDQNPSTKPGFEMVQGLVNLVDGESTSGGNVLISGSHNDFPHHYLFNPLYTSRLLDLEGEDWLELLSSDPILQRYKSEEKVRKGEEEDMCNERNIRQR
jgi:hypothetical protein